ncbi:hypothetical protein PHYC_01673 [Phycisphaerales bacterium]|nr:hypothetical protein PHYC_01673 [Phycisphaerales bacterium]
MRRRTIVWVAALLCTGGAALAGPVNVTVTSVSGRSVYLDRGRGAGIEVGMRVRLVAPGGEQFDGVVQDVSSGSARVELPPGVPMPPIGSAGVIDVPDAPEPPPEPGPEKPPPEHPPWTRPPEERTPDMPLLAPAYARPAKERPPSFHGRIFTHFEYTKDQGGDRDSQYIMARLGTSMTFTNPFGQGGRMQFAGEYDRRGASLIDEGDLTDDEFIIDRFSYAIGGEQYSAYRAEFGRFFSYFLPDVGLVDGVEGALQLESGLRLGGGAGAYPRAFGDRQWGDDYGFHVFADYQPLKNRKLTGTVGYQKTWHDGSPDRDVLMARVNWRPTDSWWFFGSARADIYDNSEPVKSGIQLTDAWLQARYSPDHTKGVALSYSHYTWADLKRDEFEYIPIELIRDGRVDRVDLSGWHYIFKDIRLSGRVNYYTDQRNDGLGAEAGADWNNAFKLPMSLHADIFHTEGSYASGDGFRLEARPGGGSLQGLLGYEFFRYQNSGSIGESDDFVRHTLRAGISWQLRKWYFNLTADRYFGDFEDAYSLGLYAEFRF